jgi:hypothetical protein
MWAGQFAACPNQVKPETWVVAQHRRALSRLRGAEAARHLHQVRQQGDDRHRLRHMRGQRLQRLLHSADLGPNKGSGCN